MFRHGSIQDAYKEGGTTLAKLRGGHKDEKSIRLYAATDAERDTKVRNCTKDSKAKEAFIKAFLQTTNEQADRIRKDKNTNIIFTPANLEQDDKRQVKEEEKWKKMKNVWETYIGRINEGRKIAENAKKQMKEQGLENSSDVSNLIKMLHYKMIEIKGTVDVLLRSNTNNQNQNNQNNNVRNNSSTTSQQQQQQRQQQIQPQQVNSTKTKVPIVHKQPAQQQKFQIFVEQGSNRRFLVVKNPLHVFTKDDIFRIRKINVQVSTIWQEHGFSWSPRFNGWQKQLKN
jgi:hypothetical protein